MVGVVGATNQLVYLPHSCAAFSLSRLRARQLPTSAVLNSFFCEIINSSIHEHMVYKYFLHP
jgi:hypothetical protein